MSNAAEYAPGETQVWDRFVRVSHWTLVAAFFIAYVTEDDFLTLHTWPGYVAFAYVVARVAWGFVGTRHARFSDFVCGPRAAARYLADLALMRSRRHRGHSPAGAWMVFMLLAAIAATTISGELLLGAKEHKGPLAGLFAASAPAGPAPAATARATPQPARVL
ncbi:MAG: cytochrome b/b6 domain-containing protein, partial [Proteobacteria bacterium]|nr:cytochrome b/b6 domain-containing protein [Pseudomonadota bacterium]